MNIRRSAILIGILATCSLAYAYKPIGEIDANVPAAEREAPPQAEDQSVLWIRSDSRVYVMVMDARGRKSGVDWKSRKTLQNIPNSRCEAEFIENQYTKETDDLRVNMTLEPAAQGRYSFYLRGLKPGPYTISLSALSKQGSSLPSREIEGLISEGEDKTFVLDFQPEAQSALTIVEEPPHGSKKKR